MLIILADLTIPINETPSRFDYLLIKKNNIVILLCEKSGISLCNFTGKIVFTFSDFLFSNWLTTTHIVWTKCEDWSLIFRGGAQKKSGIPMVYGMLVVITVEPRVMNSSDNSNKKILLTRLASQRETRSVQLPAPPFSRARLKVSCFSALGCSSLGSRRRLMSWSIGSWLVQEE